jgi:thiol:disulfide interchange protein
LQIAHSIPEEYNNMPLVNLVIALIVVGLALWLINRFIPMQSGIKTILNVVVVVAVGIWVLQATGLWGPISSYRISH